MAKELSDEDLKRYYSIGEVAKLLGVTTTKIRYWDKEFSHIKPTKNSRGDRRFTKDNVRQLRRVHHLLNDRGFTIEGARREVAASKDDTGGKEKIVERLLGVKRLLNGLLKG